MRKIDVYTNISIGIIKYKMESKVNEPKKIDSVVTLTFGEQAENGRQMKKVASGKGGLAPEGMTVEELQAFIPMLEKAGFTPEWKNLGDLLAGTSAKIKGTETTIMDIVEPAGILIVRGFANKVLEKYGGAEALYWEQLGLNWDRRCKMYGVVREKKARRNLCYSNFSQEPNYEAGLGRVYEWKNVPLTALIRAAISDSFGPKAQGLQGEGNWYYDPEKCGIGFHGDAERRIVYAVRAGLGMPLEYRWFYQGRQIGEPWMTTVNGGDLYIMSHKAAGTDWRLRRIPTLRHAAGAKKFRTLKKTQRKLEA